LQVESSRPTGVGNEELWYSLPRDLTGRPPDRGARVDPRVDGKRDYVGFPTILFVSTGERAEAEFAQRAHVAAE
jgi:hypothetical protein